jgi:hypothetical protein
MLAILCLRASFSSHGYTVDLFLFNAVATELFFDCILKRKKGDGREK